MKNKYMHMKMARRAFQNSKNQEIWSKNKQDMALRKKGQTGGTCEILAKQSTSKPLFNDQIFSN